MIALLCFVLAVLNSAPRYLIRDRDHVYGDIVTRRLCAMGIRDKPIAPGSP
jgi:transposase InsO family protein